ncbi:hypothetical protein QMK17_06860 [Rhodococcus sp. G-MC3]|uniref:hypothetical protein n=1 Tax=Rhodococcus sp. G-MC3 TaxID=3046209 RepID=UPI0024B92131|nr:hypothetical protein [Rhodococcus sp. G-MC3]MDJ0393048.1 hypothetical protein [Rhodococcus sp. G-MC3]
MATNGGASWFRRLFLRSSPERLDPTRTDLVIVAESFDDAESASSVLERAGSSGGWKSGEETVFRHHLVLPADTVEDAVSTAAQDEYEQVQTPSPQPRIPETGYRMEVSNAVSLTLQRVQIIDALHCSQERSRMAGLAQRRGGTVSGWDALQPESIAVDSAD